MMDARRLREENLALLAQLKQGQVLVRKLLNSSLKPSTGAQTPRYHENHHPPKKCVDESLIGTSYHVKTGDKTPIKVRFVDLTRDSDDESEDAIDAQSYTSKNQISPLQTERHLIELTPVVSPPSRRTPKSVLRGRDIINRHVKLDSEMGDWDNMRPKSRLEFLDLLSTDRTPDSSLKGDIGSLYFSKGNRRPEKYSCRTALHPFPAQKSHVSSDNLKSRTSPPSDKMNNTNYSSTKKSANSTSYTLDSDAFNLCQSDRPLLGYDWIAANLDNSQTAADLSDSFIEDIKKFRYNNKLFCEDKLGNEKLFNWFTKTSPVVPKMSHTCVHGYVLNDRLYPEPINADEKGNSVCPVCLVQRPDPTPDSPGFVRISIPKNALISPEQVKPHRRKSFDCANTVSLSMHCLVGWESSKPSSLPPASTMDLRRAVNGISENFITDVEEEAKRLNPSSSMGKRLTSHLARGRAIDRHRSLLFELEASAIQAK